MLWGSHNKANQSWYNASMHFDNVGVGMCISEIFKMFGPLNKSHSHFSVVCEWNDIWLNQANSIQQMSDSIVKFVC